MFIIFPFFYSCGLYDFYDRDNRRGGGGDFRAGSGSPMFRGGFNVFFGPSPLDLFFYRPYYGYYNTPRRQRGFSNGEPDEMG